MARTVRNLPEWAKNVDWSCGSWQVNNFRFSGVRDCKSDRGDGKNRGWNECDTVLGKRFYKRIARRVSRRHAANLIREQLNDLPCYIRWYEAWYTHEAEIDPEISLQISDDAEYDEYLDSLNDYDYLDFIL